MPNLNKLKPLNEQLMRILPALSCLYIPFLFVYYFWASRDIGFFPNPGNPDPKSLDLHEYFGPALGFGLIISWFAFLAYWANLSLYFIVNWSRGLNKRLILLGLSLLALAYGTLYSEAFNWFLD